MDNGLLLLGGLAAAWVLSKAHTGKNLQFNPLDASWDGGALHVRIGVLNPTNDSLNFNSLAGTIYINGTAAGSVSDFTPAIIAPNNQTVIAVSYQPSIFGVASTVLNYLNNGGGVGIEIRGTANVNSIPVPFDVKFQAISN